MRQRFCEHFEACLWLSECSMGFGEERQQIGPIGLCSRGTNGSQALVYLPDSFLHLSLVCQRPAAQDNTTCHPERKSLVRGKVDEGVGALLSSTHLAAELTGHHCTTQGMSQAIGGGKLLRQRHGLVTPRQ